jgi:hypothetical protein
LVRPWVSTGNATTMSRQLKLDSKVSQLFLL